MRCQAFPDEQAARRAVDALAAANADDAVRPVTGAPSHEACGERAGAFAGSVEPDDPVGTFVRRRDAGSARAPRSQVERVA